MSIYLIGSIDVKKKKEIETEEVCDDDFSARALTNNFLLRGITICAYVGLDGKNGPQSRKGLRNTDLEFWKCTYIPLYRQHRYSQMKYSCYSTIGPHPCLT